MAIVFFGIELAKGAFSIHGIDVPCNSALAQPRAARSKFVGVIAFLPPCSIATEACLGPHDSASHRISHIPVWIIAHALRWLANLSARRDYLPRSRRGASNRRVAMPINLEAHSLDRHTKSLPDSSN